MLLNDLSILSNSFLLPDFLEIRYDMIKKVRKFMTPNKFLATSENKLRQFMTPNNFLVTSEKNAKICDSKHFLKPRSYAQYTPGANIHPGCKFAPGVYFGHVNGALSKCTRVQICTRVLIFSTFVGCANSVEQISTRVHICP